MQKVITVSFLAAILMIAMISCKEKENGIAVTGVRLDRNEPVTIGIDENLPLTATVIPDGATQKELVWATGKSGVATVKGGVVTGILPGTVTIFVTTVDGGYSDSIAVTVTVYVSGVAITQKELELTSGETGTVAYTITPVQALNKSVRWTSSNSAIASVDEQTGFITAVSGGTAVITATTVDGGYTDDCVVTVTSSISVRDVTLDETAVTVKQGQWKTMNCTVIPPNASNPGVTWTSSDPAVAAVDEETGFITALSQGTATITVTTDDGGHTADCAVTVVYENLLNNPSFEEPDDNSAEIMGWTKIPQEWFDAYYEPGLTVSVPADINRVGDPIDQFLNTGNGKFFNDAGGLDGKKAVRITANRTGGIYQIIAVIPGVTYEFSANIGFKRNTADAMAIRDDETVKILSTDGAELIDGATIPATFADKDNNNSSTEQFFVDETAVKGQFTVPENVTEMRFQFDICTFASPNQSPLVVIDKCDLKPVLE